MKSHSHNLVAYHVQTQINILHFRQLCSYTLIKHESTFLLYQLDDATYLYVKNYGSIVFINANKILLNAVFSEILNLKITLKALPHYSSNIFENPILNKKTLQSIHIEKLTPNRAHVILLNVAEYVAIKHYLAVSETLQTNIKIYTQQLENKGQIKLSKTKMRQLIGKTMRIKSSITEHLFMFSTPDVAWTNPEVLALNTSVKQHLDIENRYNGLQNTLQNINQHLYLFKDILQHRYSSMLEWIIIGLILFEVVQLIFEKI